MPVVPIASDEVEEFVAAYAAAARRSAEGGIEGVEVAAGHGYLVYRSPSVKATARRVASSEVSDGRHPQQEPNIVCFGGAPNVA